MVTWNDALQIPPPKAGKYDVRKHILVCSKSATVPCMVHWNELKKTWYISYSSEARYPYTIDYWFDPGNIDFPAFNTRSETKYEPKYEFEKLRKLVINDTSIDLQLENDKYYFTLNNVQIVDHRNTAKLKEPEKHVYKYKEDVITADLFAHITKTYKQHYNTKEGIQCFDKWLESENAGELFGLVAEKYLWRVGKKGDKEDFKHDLFKCFHYLVMALYVDFYK